MVSAEEEEILTALPGAIIAADAGGRIVFANDLCGRMLGLPSGDDLVGRRITSLMPERMIPVHEQGFQRYLKTGHSRLLGKRVRVPALRADRRETELDIRIRMFRRPDGTDLIVAALDAVMAGDGALDLTVLRLEQELKERLYVMAR